MKAWRRVGGLGLTTPLALESDALFEANKGYTSTCLTKIPLMPLHVLFHKNKG